MKEQRQYLVVDDDVTNNLICEYNIKSFDGQAKVRTFTQPELALNILSESDLGGEVILFLDLNMPTMTGWEFLERFKNLNSEITESISIYILTSAIENGEENVGDYPFLKGFFSKPLCRSYLERIIKLEKEKS